MSSPAIRRYRVELSEIEASTTDHLPLSPSAVITHLDPLPVVQVGNTQINTADLRRLCRQTLPYYTVPSRVALLDALPVHHSGNVDRRALSNSTEMSERSGNE